MLTFISYFIIAILSLVSSGHATNEAQAQAQTQASTTHLEATQQAPSASPEAWAHDTLQAHGVALREGVELYMTNEHNCGADISPVHMGGCTYTTADHRTIVTVSPQLAYSPEGVHVLMHEVGHSVGITDECTAEAFAHYYTQDYNLWSYPQCAGPSTN